MKNIVRAAGLIWFSEHFGNISCTLNQTSDLNSYIWYILIDIYTLHSSQQLILARLSFTIQLKCVSETPSGGNTSQQPAGGHLHTAASVKVHCGLWLWYIVVHYYNHSWCSRHKCKTTQTLKVLSSSPKLRWLKVLTVNYFSCAADLDDQDWKLVFIDFRFKI